MKFLSSLRRVTFARQERDWLFACIVGVIFAYVEIRGHLAHEMWRDELHCWAMARNSMGLWDLLTGERRYDGHPFLWYYLLHLASRVHRSYVGLHVVTVAVGVSAALLWLRYAPLSRALRVLTLSSYYIIYEYGVVARNYILGILVMFAFCALYRPYRVRYIALAITLALLAATSMYGAIMALALGLFLFTRGLRISAPDASDDRTRITLPTQWIAGLAIYIFGLGVVVASTIPPADEIYAPQWAFDFSLAAMRYDFARYWAAMFPFHTWTEWSWLYTDFFGSRLALSEATIAWFGFAWFVAWLIALRRSPMIAVAYALAILMMMAAQHGVYPAGLRHLGHYFILLIACIWLYVRDTRQRGRNVFIYALLTPCLIIHAFTGVAALRADEHQVFSHSKVTAEFMLANHLENRRIVAYDDYCVTTVATTLDRPFLLMGTGETSDVIIQHNRLTVPGHPAILEAAANITRTYGPTLILLNSPLSAVAPVGFETKLLYQSGVGGIIPDESFWIYEISILPTAASG